MCTVSPARKSARSRMVCAMVGPSQGSDGRPKRNGSMPSSHDECTRPRSPSCSAITSRPRSRPRSARTWRQSKKCSGQVEVAGRQRVLGRKRRRSAPGRRASVVAVATAVPLAVGDRDAGAADRLRAVERRHPRERRFAAPLEVHGEVRHQRRGGDEHRRRLAEERAAEPRARQLDDVQPGPVERQADDLGRVVAARGRQLDRRRPGRRPLAGKDGAGARGDGDPPEPVQRVCRRHPRDAAPDAELTAGSRAQAAHRDRQRGVGLRLDDAEAGGELGERRVGIGADLEREAGGVLERAAGVVGQTGGQLETECSRREGRAAGRRSPPPSPLRRAASGVQR